MTDRAALLEAACLFFAGVGLLLAALGHTVLFDVWRDAVGADLFGSGGIPHELDAFLRLTNAVLGGSIVGKWVAAWFLVRHGLRAGRRWAFQALLVGHVGWFLLDSGLSLTVGAASNVLLINLVPGVVFLGLLLWARPAAWTPPTSTDTGLAWRWLVWACGVSVAIGLLVIVGVRWPVFAPYNSALESLFGSSEALITWQVFAYGLVGAAFTAHFVMLWWAAAAERGARWVTRAVIVSLLAWFVVDSAGSIAQGAWFNVLMINVPSLLAVGLPAVLATR